MVNYKDYSTEDLVQDEYFRRWVLSPAMDNTQLWEEFLVSNPEKQADVTRARALLLAMHNLDQDPSPEQGERMWAGVLGRIDEEQETEHPVRRLSFNQFSRYWGYAAAMLILGAFTWWIVAVREFGRIPRTYEKQVSQEEGRLIEYVNRTNGAVRRVLPDGSVVTVARNAKVSYEKDFSGSQRKVYLSGEGYFEVEKNPKKPFLVFAGSVVTQVVGTRFTVSSKSQNADITVSVKSGKVKVFTIDHYKDPSRGDNQEPIMLAANEAATFHDGKRLLTKGLVAEAEVIRAPEKYPNFNFKETSIEDVFMTLGDSYGVAIEYDPRIVANCNLTAELGNEPLFKKLDIICRTIDATYEVFGSRIIVNAKGCTAY